MEDTAKRLLCDRAEPVVVPSTGDSASLWFLSNVQRTWAYCLKMCWALALFVFKSLLIYLFVNLSHHLVLLEQELWKHFSHLLALSNHCKNCSVDRICCSDCLSSIINFCHQSHFIFSTAEEISCHFLHGIVHQLNLIYTVTYFIQLNLIHRV